MSTFTLTEVKAKDLLPGMLLDLEDDSYATIECEPGCLDCISTINSFQMEFVKVEGIEYDNMNVIRIDCDVVSFGCPPNHKLKVALDAE